MTRATALLIGLLLAAPAAAQNVLFPANPGDMIVKGTVGAWTAVPGGTAGCVLMSQGPTAAPTWSCALPLNFSLPPMAPNTVWGNVTAAQAIPQQVTATQFLDTIDYDIQRTPLNGSILTKVAGVWRAIPPTAQVGWVWTNQGVGQSPQWVAPGGYVVPGAAGTCLVSNGPTVAPSFTTCPTPGSFPVDSVFGRTGTITTQGGDYSVGQVTGAAPAASPVFTGDPQAPTPLTADNDTSVATTAYVKSNLAAFPATSAIADARMIANTSGGSASPIATTGTSWFDKAYCNTVGYIVVRLTGAWTCAQGVGVPAQWYGLVCDGDGAKAAANAAAIQAAIVAVQPNDAVFSGGAVNIILTGGVNSTCPVTSGVITIPGRVRLCGTGMGTNLATTSATGDVITVTGGGVTVCDMAFTSSVVRTGGAYIRLNGGSGTFENLNMSAGYDSFFINGVLSPWRIDKVYSTGHVHRGISCTGTTDLGVISNSVFAGASRFSSDAGFWTDVCKGLIITHSQFLTSAKGVAFEPCTTCEVADMQLTNVYMDNNTTGFYAKTTADATSLVSRVYLTTTKATSSFGESYYLEGTSPGSIDGIWAVNAIAYNGAANGWKLVGVVANVWSTGGQISGMAGSGWNIANNISNFGIFNMKIGTAGRFGPNAGFGIEIGTGSDNYAFTHNSLTGNTAGASANGSAGAANKIITPNL